MLKTPVLFKKTMVIGILILVIGMGINSAGSKIVEKKSIKPNSSGNTLYVGGSGEGNYTKIQDAIDDAYDGDTVFVYDESSPYYELLVIDKSINLVGEDRNTTIIDGLKGNYTINILDNINDVTITGFTLIKSEEPLYGAIKTYSNYNNIHNINIFDHQGIRVYGSIGNNISNNMLVVNYGIIIYHSNENTIYNNYIISGSSGGIQLINSSNNIVSKNTVVDGRYGIHIGDESENNHIKSNILNNITYRCLTIDGNNNLIYNNIINNSDCGIALRSDSKNNDIYENEIKSCTKGVTLTGAENNNINRNNIFECNLGLFYSDYSIKNSIYENNFIDNKNHGSWRVYLLEIPSKSLRNSWDRNYWGKSLFFPKFIKGYIVRHDMWYPYIELFPSFRIDWHPAKEPYDI